MLGLLRSAGQQIELACAHRRLARVLEEGAAGQLTAPEVSRPDVRVTVESSTAAFATGGWEVVTRGAWRRAGQVVLRDACSSGLDLLVTPSGPTLDVVARYRPPALGRAASLALRARSRLLLRAVLLQYPALWWGQRLGRAPLHASVCTLGRPAGPAVLIAGPGGVGKSTLVNAELARGALATCDNVCVSDGHTAWGLAEPRRLPAGAGARRPGRRMPHGRREAPWPGRAESLVPDYVLVVRRGAGRPAPALASCPPPCAARSLAAGTYMAGELRRYWAFAATLALATGTGDTHPAVTGIAEALTARLPCLGLTLGEQPGTLLGDALDAHTTAEVTP
jgi:hypothetical protein